MTTRDQFRNLSPAQQRAVSVLLATGSTSKAAQAAGVSERTLRRWRAFPPFADELRKVGRQNAGEAMSILLATQMEAVETLREALRTGSPALRVRAARALLDIGLKLADEELERRITRLEEASCETDRPDLRISSSS